jgi:Ni/Co efflux regulator RcnB
MTKLKRIALAASAALLPITAAAAEDQAGGAGHSWQERGSRAGAAAVQMHRQGSEMRHGTPHHGRRFQHIRRINRGGVVPHFWWGPQFVVHNWQNYGFTQPMHGGRWIRYYDDALLIDRNGRVHDGRYGQDWDRYGDRWGERDGIPVYVGDGDFEPEEEDYEWAERWERGEGGEYADDTRYGPPQPDCSNPCTRTYNGPPPPAHAYGQAYGYGCGCGTVTITETTTTTAPVVEQVTYYEYEEVRAAPRKKRVIRRAPARRAAPRPGERG